MDETGVGSASAKASRSLSGHPMHRPTPSFAGPPTGPTRNSGRPLASPASGRHPLWLDPMETEFLRPHEKRKADRCFGLRAGRRAGSGGGHRLGPNQAARASPRPLSVPSPTQATWPSGRTRTAAGAGPRRRRGAPALRRSSRRRAGPGPAQAPTASARPGSPRLISDRRAPVQRRVDTQRAIGAGQVEVGHPPAEQRVILAEVVADVEAEPLGGEALAWLVDRRQLGHLLAQRRGARVAAVERARGHRVPQRRAVGGWRSAS